MTGLTFQGDQSRRSSWQIFRSKAAADGNILNNKGTKKPVYNFNYH